MAEPTVNLGLVAVVAAGFAEVVGVDLRHAVFAGGAYVFFQVASLQKLTRFQAWARAVFAGLLGAALAAGAAAYFELASPPVQLAVACACGALVEKLPKWATAMFDKFSGTKNGQ